MRADNRQERVPPGVLEPEDKPSLLGGGVEKGAEVSWLAINEP